MEIFSIFIVVAVLWIINNNIISKITEVKIQLNEIKTKLNNLMTKIDALEKENISMPQNTKINLNNNLEKEVVNTPNDTSFENQIDDLKKEIEKISDKSNVFGGETSPSINTDKPIEQQPHLIETKPELHDLVTTSTQLDKSLPLPEKKPVVVESKKSWFENFKEKNPDLEKFIGENLINKIGVFILVLGISFFVKYAIDKNWINETSRVGIGILAGSLVMGIAHKLKKEYTSFSSVIVAGAISIYYFTIAIGFHDYQSFSQTTAFIIMVIITAFSTMISVAYDRQELAILSLIGGFAVPFMVSNGSGNYVVLFTYILILNLGILAIAYFKKWNLLTFLSFIFTTVLFTGWFSKQIDIDTFPLKGAFLFASIYYFVFSITAVLHNIKNQGQFNKMEYFMIIANTFVYFGLGTGIINHYGIAYKGVFTLSLAVYNFVYTLILFKKFGVDKKAVYLLIGLTLTFVTLTIPIQFNGNYITLFWAAEGVMLYWLFQKSKIQLFKLGAIIINSLTIISLLIDWFSSYHDPLNEINIIFNPAFITGIVVIAAFLVLFKIIKNDEHKIQINNIVIDISSYKIVLFIVATILGYFQGLLEIIHQSGYYIANESSQWSFPLTYHFLFSLIIVFFSFKSKKQVWFQFSTILASINVVLYIVFFHKLPIHEIENNIYEKLNTYYAFYFHYVILSCLFYFIYLLWQQVIVNSKNENIPTIKKMVWILVFVIVFILSNELLIHRLYFVDTNKIYQQLKIRDITDSMMYYEVDTILHEIKVQVIKIAYPILWGALSFAFLVYGIKKQWKQLRIIALTLLGLTILKLFVYDINDVSETGKIIAFILLGVLILIISFVYQKIKKLVIDDESKNNNEAS